LKLRGLPADEYAESSYAPKALYNLGGMAIEDGETQSAIQSFREIVNEYPDDRMAKKAKKKLKQLSLVGRKAPELQVSEWLGTEPIELKQYLGNVVLLEFWTTWCPHCRKQLPHMKEIYKKYADKGLTLITISRNDKDKGQTTEKMKQFMEENEIPYPVGIDDNRKTTKDYISGSIPAVALIDRKGIIRWRSHPGYLKNETIEALLTEK
ncbi:redoxin domain-containing protein, partial [Thermodesulfobacteriota bacterium]